MSYSNTTAWVKRLSFQGVLLFFAKAFDFLPICHILLDEVFMSLTR